MSFSDSIDHILQQLPELLSWVLPGLILMFTYRRLKYEDRSDEKERISLLKAIGISLFIRYTVIIVLSCLSGDWLFGLDGNTWIAICSCLIAVPLGGLLGWASNRPITKKFSEKYLNLTIESNPFYDLAPKNHGGYVRVILKTGKTGYFFGQYSNCYNRGNEDWIVITEPIFIEGDIDTERERNHSRDSLVKATETKMLINAKEVKYIDFVYIK